MTISFSEKDIEDYLVGHWQNFAPDWKFLGRQVHVIGGIIDVLAAWENNPERFIVIEIKKEPPNDATFGQILRYRAVMEHHRFFSFVHYFAEIDEEAVREATDILDKEKGPPIDCVLLVPEIDFPRLLTAISMNVQIIIYNVSLEGIKFRDLQAIQQDRMRTFFTREIPIVDEWLKYFIESWSKSVNLDPENILEEAEEIAKKMDHTPKKERDIP